MLVHCTLYITLKALKRFTYYRLKQEGNFLEISKKFVFVFSKSISGHPIKINEFVVLNNLFISLNEVL